jgi:CheY-like chemotaxis protein
VSLRILFADDSMTAQNMGKKILSDAGYDVVAVSNGAAAVKKIAEQKPDIIILDVYMPGYSGLEVCEKVRGSLDTLKTPVLLTVGKMEPYKPEDANRVKADGVIIKPFEASDLLAIVKKFEERIGNAPPPLVEQTVLLDRQYEEAAVTPPEVLAEHTIRSRSPVQPMVEVPDHMASSAAFGDMLGAEPSSTMNHYAVNTPAATFETSVIVPAPPVPAAEQEAAAPATVEERVEPAFVEPAPTVTEQEVIAPAEASPDAAAAPLETAPEPIAPAERTFSEHAPPEHRYEAASVNLNPAPAIEPRHPHFIPVFKEPETPPAPEHVFVPTATAPVGDLEIPREPELQETAEETTRSTLADRVEPGLIATGQPVEAPVEARPSPGIGAEESYPAPQVAASSEVTDADFEARVAAAMAAYSQSSEAEAARLSATETRSATAAPVHSFAAPVPEARAAEKQSEEVHSVAASIPSFEYRPPVRTAEPPPEAAPVIDDSAPLASPSEGVDPSAVVAGVEAALPEAAASVAAQTGAEHHTIAQAVHRVMERLKPELVEEIMKELNSKR